VSAVVNLQCPSPIRSKSCLFCLNSQSCGALDQMLGSHRLRARLAILEQHAASLQVERDQASARAAEAEHAAQQLAEQVRFWSTARLYPVRNAKAAGLIYVLFARPKSCFGFSVVWIATQTSLSIASQQLLADETARAEQAREQLDQTQVRHCSPASDDAHANLGSQANAS